jgi:hypothetical protein
MFFVWLIEVVAHVIARNLDAPQWLVFALATSIVPVSIFVICRAAQRDNSHSGL